MTIDGRRSANPNDYGIADLSGNRRPDGEFERTHSEL
jgi:hypothetical protein